MKDKRIPINQAIQMVHDHYDHLEMATLSASQKALKDTYGFGPKRYARFKEAYLQLLGEEAAKVAEDMRRKAKRRLK